MIEIRLQKIISDSGLLSRRKADLLIRQGRVTLNGKRAVAGEKCHPINDNILVDGKRIPRKLNHKVLLLNKPIGVVSNCKDTHGRKTVLNLIIIIHHCKIITIIILNVLKFQIGGI